MNKFDKPYRMAPAFDTKKTFEMFNLALKLDTHELLQYSLINQVPFDISDEDGNSLIHIVITIDSRKATHLSKLSVIKFLVHQGVNPDKPNKYNQTPLHLACQCQSEVIVEYLLSIDVNTNFNDNMGLTPFHYLLTGDIKTIYNNTEIIDFIPPPKNSDVKKDNELLEIKRVINDIINENLDEKFPIYKTINETIQNILDFDPIMIDIKVDLQSKIRSIVSNNNPSEITTFFDIAQNQIKKKLLSRFSDLPKIDLTIHKTDNLNSWAHPTNKTEMSLIKNGKIKKVIKADILTCRDNIIKLFEDFKFKKIDTIDYTVIESEYNNYYNNNNFNDVNNSIRHPDAIDNASSIINFKTLKYAGGPRNINVIHPVLPNNIISEFLNIITLNEPSKLFYMLGAINTTDTYAYISGLAPDLLQEYLLLAYYAIIDTDSFNTNAYLTTDFARKWYNIYINGCDIRTWLFGMLTDLECRKSETNLEGDINFRTLMLITGLEYKNISLSLGIINAYKPHLIKYITNTGITPHIKIAKMVLILLLNTDDNLIINDILSTSTTKYYRTIDKYINYIYILVWEYFENTPTFNNYIKTDQDECRYYNTHYIPNDKPIDVLCKIIFNIYKEMIVKPLKQTILDFIYLLNQYDNNRSNIGIFNDITFTEFYMTSTLPITNTTKLDENILPSNYGYLNYNLDNITQRNKNHFYIAHLMGLYYEGSISSLNINLTTHHVINIANNSLNQSPLPLYFISLDPALGIDLSDESKNIYYDIGNDDIILPDIISYFYLLYKRIEHYYDEIKKLNSKIQIITNNLIKGNVKDLHTLYTTLYPQIVTYSRIIDNFNNSYTEFEKQIERNNDRKTIWNNLTFKNSYKKINNFNYKELAKNLNNINSKYYLYYYIYSPTKLVKLSRFNYYQIPETDATKYIYYSDIRNDDIINIDIDQNDRNDLLLSDNRGNATKVNENSVKNGLINDFSLGNYDNILNEYIKGTFSTFLEFKNNEYFIRIKNDKLPPSLYVALEHFYKYTLIELIERVITYIDNNKTINDFYNKIQGFVKINNFNIDNYDLSLYKIVADLIQEIVKEQYNIFINNESYNTLDKILNSSSVVLPTNLFIKKNMEISFTTTNIDLNRRYIKESVKNLYEFLIKSKKEDNIFILYPNDLTNINRLKTKYGITINTKIIDLLLEKRGFIHHLNINNLTPIYSLLKNYNYEPIKKLKKLGINFKDFEEKSPIEFIKEDFNNNLNKILYNIDNIKTTSDVLKNFDDYLYNDVKLLILSNEVFGNNILSYLPLSFNMSTYLTLQYLVENLINTDDNYSVDDMTELFKFMDIDIKDINKNFLGETLSNYNIPNKFEFLIAVELLKEKKDNLDLLKTEKNSIDDNISKLTISNPSLATKMTITSKYKKIEEDIKSLNNDIRVLKFFIKRENINSNMLSDISSGVEYKIIERYNKIPNHKSLIMKAWDKVLDLKYDKKNYNLGLIQLLIKQKELVNKNDIIQLTTMLNGLEKIAQIGEDYFNNPKLTDQNKVAHFIRDMLEYITVLTIATSIELIMRRILFTYYSNTSTDKSIDYINSIIDYILEAVWGGHTKSLINTLKEDISIELVKNASEIFDNRYEEQGYNNRPTREILIDFFQRLRNYPGQLPDEILNVFNKDVVAYFDTFVSKSIILWQVNAENIFKYFINNYRCVKTLIEIY